MKLINLRPASDDDVHCRAGRVLPFLPTGGRSYLIVSGRVGRQSAQMTMEVLQGPIFSQARVVMGLSVQFSALSCKLTSAPLIILPKSEILIVLPAVMYYYLFIIYLLFAFEDVHPSGNKVWGFEDTIIAAIFIYLLSRMN